MIYQWIIKGAVFLGNINALYLVVVSVFLAGKCGLFDCSDVLLSSYSSIFSIPLSIYNLGVCLALFALVIPKRWNDLTFAYFRFLSGTALFTGIFLFFLQLVVIKSFCFFCIAATILFFVMFLMTFFIEKSMIDADFIKGTKLLVIVLLIFPPLVYSLSSGDKADFIHYKGIRIAMDVIDSRIEGTLYDLAISRYLLRQEAVYDYIFEQEVLQSGIGEEAFLHRLGVKEGATSKEIAALKKNYLNELKDSGNFSFDIDHPLIHINVNPHKSFLKQLSPNKSGKRRVVIFSDIECPHCKKLHFSMNNLIQKFPDKYTIEYRFFPLKYHKNAREAATAAICAGQQGQFWKYLDKLYEHQNELSQRLYFDLIDEQSLDRDLFRQCINDKGTIDIIDADIEEGRRLGIQGVPSFYVDGVSSKILE